MKPENQVVSLELSKELEKAGYRQDGLWWWVKIPSKNYLLGMADLEQQEFCVRVNNRYIWFEKDIEPINNFAAPTCAELGERLPNKIFIRGFNYYLFIAKICGEWIIDYKLDNLPLHSVYGFITQKAKTEANVRAKMWLYLKKEELI